MLQCTPELHLTLLSSVRLDRADLHLPIGSLHKSGPTLDPFEDPYRELSRVVLFPALQQTFKNNCYLGYFMLHSLLSFIFLNIRYLF